MKETQRDRACTLTAGYNRKSEFVNYLVLNEVLCLQKSFYAVADVKIM